MDGMVWFYWRSGGRKQGNELICRWLGKLRKERKGNRLGDLNPLGLWDGS